MVDFTKAAAGGVGAALMLAHLPHRFTMAKTEGFVVFSDAAVRPEHPAGSGLGW